MTGPDPYRDPEGAGASRQPMPCEIDPHTRMGAVSLVVSDLSRSCEYYEQAIGLAVLERDGERASLGAGGRELLELVEVAGARAVRAATGLFHVAYLLPEREDLGIWLSHAIDARVSLEGASDHFVSEALYLRDPDGHGIEVYADRPRSLWEGHVDATMNTTPLDLPSLLALAEGRDGRYGGMPDGTVVGHVHLQVADIASTIAFYAGVLGFGLMAEIQGTAAFFGAGGYHHQIAGNTWNSAGRAPAPDGFAALRQLTIVLPDDQARSDVRRRLDHHGIDVHEREDGLAVRDPSGTLIVLS
ncbi:MAG: VOC family protein [Baekduia sp.]